jgi:hypothetical protein
MNKAKLPYIFEQAKGLSPLLIRLLKVTSVSNLSLQAALKIYKGLAIAAKSTLKILLLRQLGKNACNLGSQHIRSWIERSL